MNSPKLFLTIILIGCILGVHSAEGQTTRDRIFEAAPVTLTETGINSIHSDFGPAIIQDSLYFTSFNDKLAEKSDDQLRRKAFYELYKVGIDKQGNPTSARLALKGLTPPYNNGPVAWCAKTGELFVTQNYPDQSSKLKPFNNVQNRLKIVLFKQEKGGWIAAGEFPFNQPDYSVGHPAVTETGDTLIFASDMPGGYGKTDLYMSVRKGGKWETPINLGPKINTAEKEEFPFITDRNLNGRFLVFGSTGRQGLGGLDLYYTPFPSNYAIINHFEPPINSPYDDFAMVIADDRDFGFLTSDRPGTGNDDIYRFSFKRIPKQQFIDLVVLDKANHKPLMGVKVETMDHKIFLTDQSGHAKPIPYLASKSTVSLTHALYHPQTHNLRQPAAQDGLTNDTIQMSLIVNQKITLNNILYNFGKWDILPEAAKELDKLVSVMNQNPTLKVELRSHTDERGTAEFNMKLSVQRANAAVNYIVSKGIDRSRIHGTGFGKSQLIYKSRPGKPCTIQQNKANRRTEIIIPEFTVQ